MTDTLIDRADSGEIPRFDDLGEGPTQDLRQHLRRDTTGEATENIGRYLVDTPSFEAIPRRTIELDDTVIYRIPETIGLAGPDQPKPPSPLPTPPAKLDPETGVNMFGGLGANLPEEAFPGYVGRHRHPDDQDVAADEDPRLSPWWAVAAVVAVGLAAWVGLYAAAVAVMGW